ncbi:MAG: entericidin A/B family lipoprotein, partial [Planctomycetota bacterium]
RPAPTILKATDHTENHMTKFRKTLLSLLALVLMGGIQLGCNTIEGAGEDVGEAGEALEDAAD